MCGGNATRKLVGGQGLSQRMKREREIAGQSGHGDLMGFSQEGFWLLFQVRQEPMGGGFERKSDMT